MIIREGFSVPEPTQRAWVTIGFFDGIHVGHQAIMHHISRAARQNNGKSCVVTFDRHPAELLAGRSMKLLTSWEEKVHILRELGIDMVRVLPFDSHLALLSPDVFLERLCSILRVKEIAVGSGFVFGEAQKGNVRFLENRSKKFSYRLTVVPHVLCGVDKISSSLLREWLRAGQVRRVTDALGHYPTVIGMVVRGRGVGHDIGYPTVNLRPNPVKILPGAGVYAGFLDVGSTHYAAMINVGTRPTFSDNTRSVEAHILDFNGDLYGETLQVNVIERLRDVKRFAGPQDLSLQLRLDSQATRSLVRGEVGI
jgi:riboflavin kinase/FMN adenylyltransferase